MPSDSANGSTLTFGSSVSDVTNLSITKNGNPIDLTDLLDTKHVYINGIVDFEVSATVTGATAIDPSDAAAALTLTWNDGQTDVSAVNYICTNVTTSGGVDSAITSNVTFKPSV